jgi:hypothetical protein
VPRDGGLAFHVTGTDYLAPVHDDRLAAAQPFWAQALVSEADALSRAEYLAGCCLQAALDERDGWSWPELLAAAVGAAPGTDGHAAVLERVRRHAASRYQEGYQKGVHDDDAARLLAALAVMQGDAGLLAYGPAARALAALYWQHGKFAAQRESLQRRARAAVRMQRQFASRAARRQLEDEAAQALQAFAQDFDAALATPQLCAEAADYLVSQLAGDPPEPAWVVSGAGEDLAGELARELDRGADSAGWRRDLDAASLPERWRLARDWVHAYAATRAPHALAWADDAASLLALGLPRQRVNATLDGEVDGLLGEHPRVRDGRLALNLNDFWQRFRHHTQHVVPGFEGWQRLRHGLIAAEKTRLRLAQLQARPLPTFVRNRLIDQVYLPLVGDNLAKQIGAAGEGNRSDRMGLLLLISPPGYGKTTLMEYVADRLGLIFVRINGPALGHGVNTIDPATATDSAARQELEKLNFGLAMGSNVMLYVDDIQHTSAEFLQKFIALADGTRRIEGVWDGQPRTYDLRGKRFAVVMAGNPYTESGEVFKIPDMLANRADIYNLGDVLSGREALFALSYIENSLTSNPVLLPLASREPQDVHRLVQLAQGESTADGALSHPYSAAELDEIKALLARLFRARDLLLKVNLAYIDSAAQQDAYRDEPPFKLQGSYRNMTKLAGKITALMSDDELDALLRDHYRGEAQTLTTGAEENLLKLAHLLGQPSAREAARWREVCDEFVRRRKLGGNDADGSTRIAATLLDVARAVDGLKAETAEGRNAESRRLAEAILEIAVTYRQIIMPLVAATERRLDLDQSVRKEVERVGEQLDRLAQRAPKKPAS